MFKFSKAQNFLVIILWKILSIPPDPHPPFVFDRVVRCLLPPPPYRIKKDLAVFLLAWTWHHQYVCTPPHRRLKTLTTPIFSEPLNENNDKPVDKLQTICKLCSILPRVNFNVRVSAPQKKQTTLSHGAWDPPGSLVLAPPSHILVIYDVNNMYVRFVHWLNIYFDRRRGRIAMINSNSRILVRMYGENKLHPRTDK